MIFSLYRIFLVNIVAANKTLTKSMRTSTQSPRNVRAKSAQHPHKVRATSAQSPRNIRANYMACCSKKWPVVSKSQHPKSGLWYLQKKNLTKDHQTIANTFCSHVKDGKQ